MKRDGYFKVDATEAHAAVIFPAIWRHDMTAIDTLRLVVAAGINTRLQYVRPMSRVVPITENGMH